MTGFKPLLILVIVAAYCSSCGSIKPYYQHQDTIVKHVADSIHQTLFLTGGISLDSRSLVLDAIKNDAPRESGLILLGDVLSLESLTKNETGHSSFEAITHTLSSLDKQFNPLFLIPGDDEWRENKKTDLSSLLALDKQLKDVKKKGRFVSPAKDCGYPTVIEISDRLVIVLIDSQWAIETAAHQGVVAGDCELSSILELRLALKDIIKSYPQSFIVLASHHPVYASGPTAGNYPLSSHLLPVPVVGTIITGIKTIIASNQHFGHPAYEAYRAAMQLTMESCKNCIMISGHEQSLQAFQPDHNYFLVAGSGSTVQHARKGEDAVFSYMQKGFVRLDELSDGRLSVSLMAVENEKTSTPVWQTIIEHTLEDADDPIIADMPSYTHGDSVLMPASTRYSERRFLRGKFYRREWSTPVKMPVLMLDDVHGGLSPLQLGGGNQTRSLRLENEKGEQYVLRSIDKKVTAVLPRALRGSFAENIVQDGIAASHPYGALVIPKLAAALDIFYTNPSVVYVPPQPALGIYNADIGDGVYLFEERPGGNTSGFSNFGNTSKTISTTDLIEEMAAEPNHIVDQHAVLRARLFDVWLGDWDRHDDQWRWAVFKEDGKTLYQPIPRDRDQVFYKNDGVLDYLASRPYFNPPLRRFTDKIDHLDGLIWAGKYFDHTFLNELSENDFIAVAGDMITALSDSVIEVAFKDWPKVIDDFEGARIRNDLRARRDDLVMYAKMFYAEISKEVFIPGTADKDMFVVQTLPDGMLDVSVYRTHKDESILHFHRVFDATHTKELRFFGLEKQDSFRLEGTDPVRIKLRIVGGSGEDRVINASQHLHPLVYDDDSGITLSGRVGGSHLNNHPNNNAYDRTDWELDRDFHFISPTYFTDEGFGINYTYWWTRHGFRAEPYKSKHAAGLSYFVNTGSFIGKYSGEWHHAIGALDFGLNAYLTGPTYTQFFYGLGNDYVRFDQKKTYHIVSGSQIKIEPSLIRRFGFGSMLSLSPQYHFIDIEDESEKPRFIYTPESGLGIADFGRKHFAGLMLGYRFERIDNAGYPTRGGSLSLQAGGRTSLGGEEVNHALTTLDMSLYLPFDVTGRVVLATHVGAGKIFGEYEFFQALSLGGQNKVRGFKPDRFAGEANFFQSTDLRILVLNKLGVVPFRLGIYGAFDYGRVWLDGESADDLWHTAVGGGIFIAPLGLTSFRLGYMVGEQDKQLNIGSSLKF